jgi:hypothetical protein
VPELVRIPILCLVRSDAHGTGPARPGIDGGDSPQQHACEWVATRAEFFPSASCEQDRVIVGLSRVHGCAVVVHHESKSGGEIQIPNVPQRKRFYIWLQQRELSE